MAANPLARLSELGQSVWYDYIRRDLMSSGTLDRYIEEDRLAGMTSNPTIFQKAIAETDLYDDDIQTGASDLDDAALFDAIAFADIQNAADRFRKVYDASLGRDGYVSLEVAPTLARDTEATISEVRRLFKACDRPNVMIKIPGTREGLPAIETCLTEGININITLLFSVDRYREVMEAWLSALETRVERGLPVDRLASVASFFVSRVDTNADAAIEAALKSAKSEADRKRLTAIRSRLGLANARLAYQAWIETVRDSERFLLLKEKGARPQRPLWASTSTKDPNLPDTFYVEALAGPETVNTMPPHTYDAYRDHGQPEVRVEHELDAAREAFATLEAFDIDFAAIAADLEEDGVKKFADSYHGVLEAIAAKREQIQAD